MHKADQDARFQLVLDAQYDEEITQLLVDQRLCMKEIEFGYLAETQEIKRSMYSQHTHNCISLSYLLLLFLSLLKNARMISGS